MAGIQGRNLFALRAIVPKSDAAPAGQCEAASQCRKRNTARRACAVAMRE